MIESKTFIQEFIEHTKNKGKISENTLLSQFLQQFGVTPNVCAILWLKLNEDKSFKFKHKHLLWTLYFLRHYPVQSLMESWTGYCRLTVSKIIWNIINKISELKIVSYSSFNIIFYSFYLISSISLYFSDQME